MYDKEALIQKIKDEWGDQHHDRLGEDYYVPPVRDGGLTDQLIRLAVDMAFDDIGF